MSPPRIATRLLRLVAPPQDAECVVSDLNEEFESLARERGPRAAARWYWEQTLTSLLPLLRTRLISKPGGTRGRGPLPRTSVRYTLRLLRKTPTLTAVVVITLALGIGANTAVFSVVDAVLLEPLPYASPDRLVSIWETSPRNPRLTVSPGDLVDYAQESTAFTGLAGYVPASMMLTRTDPPEQLPGEEVTANLFTVLGVYPALGRTFTADDARPSAARVAILSHATWRARFGADPAVLGRPITLNNEPRIVIGVMPAGFQALTQFTSGAPAAFFVPAAYPDEVLASRDHEIKVVGRLRPGVPAEQAQRELDAICADIARRFPKTNSDIRAVVAPLNRDIVRNVRTSLLATLGAAGLVLLIACVNVANLLVVWMMGQRREVAIRLALGARRADIFADFITRGLVLACLGGAGGLVCGGWTRNVLVSLAPGSIPRLAASSLNARVLGLTAVLSVAAGIVAGVLPAMQMLRRRVSPNLKSTELSASGTKSVMRWRGVLLAAEVAAAVVLALGAGLVVRSLILLSRVELGFQTERVLTMTVKPSTRRYPDQAARARFFEALTARVKSIPGVESVAFANQFPMRGGWGGRLWVDSLSGSVEAEADLQAVSADYFSTLRMPLVRGRLLSESDNISAAPVAVVSQTFVKRFAPNREPIGLRFRRSSAEPVITIVGVVGEVRRDGKFASVTPQVYLPAAQTPLYRVELSALAVRAAVEPQSLVGDIRRAVSSIDPDQPITNVSTLDEILSASVATRRFNSWLLTSFALLALALAMVGVYGVVTHVVSQRTREIGIRVALGATRGQVVALVLGSGLQWTLAGIVTGLLAAYAVSKVLATLLFETTPTDPLTFAAVMMIMFGVSAAASYIPARRAAVANPVSALRAD